jgi:pyrroloquinoline quinone biosynthesis protein B
MIRALCTGTAWLALAAPAVDGQAPMCQRELVVLGAGQDAGAPQIGNGDDGKPRLLPSSLALIDRASGERYLFDATPAITEQLAALDAIEPPKAGLGIDGIFLTHAHIGHYLGLAWLGREAAGAQGVPVYAMPRMEQFLKANGPWSQLVQLGNIRIEPLDHSGEVLLADDLAVVSIRVPHRDEYSETVGFYASVMGGRGFLYLPDIDSWERWKETEGIDWKLLVMANDHVFIDATFWDNNELPGRDMSEIPHPRVKATMDQLQQLPADQRAKVHFIHYNHTNPIRDSASVESREVAERGFGVAREGNRFCLD